MNMLKQGYKKNLLLLKILIIFLGLLSGLYLLDYFFDRYTLQSPIEIKVKPIIKKRFRIEDIEPLKKTSELKKEKKTSKLKSELKLSNQMSEIIRKIKILESSNGTKGLAVDCRKKGLINDIGYLPEPNFCFENEKIQDLTLTRWFEKCLRDKELNICLCKYNLGLEITNCEYVKNYNAL